MAKSKTGGAGDSNGDLLTLTDVSKRTGISMPTLQKYKKNHQDRIPSEGKGRTQRYPEKALAVFEEIKKENIAKRGRPKKSKSKKSKAKRGRKKRAGGKSKRSRAEKGGEKLLSLKDVERETGIPYATLRNYVKRHESRIPSLGKGRRRRYPEEALEVFRNIREESGRGRGPKKEAGRSKARAKGADDLARVATLLEELTARVDSLEEEIRKPLRVEITRG